MKFLVSYLKQLTLHRAYISGHGGGGGWSLLSKREVLRQRFEGEGGGGLYLWNLIFSEACNNSWLTLSSFFPSEMGSFQKIWLPLSLNVKECVPFFFFFFRHEWCGIYEILGELPFYFSLLSSSSIWRFTLFTCYCQEKKKLHWVLYYASIVHMHIFWRSIKNLQSFFVDVVELIWKSVFFHICWANKRIPCVIFIIIL